MLSHGLFGLCILGLMPFLIESQGFLLTLVGRQETSLIWSGVRNGGQITFKKRKTSHDSYRNKVLNVHTKYLRIGKHS